IGMLGMIFLYGGAAFSLYPLCVAHSNDYVASQDFVAAASGLLLVYGIGAAVGPLLAGPLIQYVGGYALLVFLASIHAGLGLFILVRMKLRAAPPPDAQEPFVMLGRTSQSVLEMIAPESDAGEPQQP